MVLIREYTRSPRVGNSIASVLESSAKGIPGIPALIVVIRVKLFWGLLQSKKALGVGLRVEGDQVLLSLSFEFMQGSDLLMLEWLCMSKL